MSNFTKTFNPAPKLEMSCVRTLDVATMLSSLCVERKRDELSNLHSFEVSITIEGKTWGAGYAYTTDEINTPNGDKFIETRRRACYESVVRKAMEVLGV